MTEKKTIPFYIKILGWLISLSAFALGFWHTHHGLRAMKPLGTEYGSYVVAGLISMVLIVAYSRAMAGVRIALLFYIICALFNFTFNTNSFYPTLLGRKLLKEETITLNDTLQNYSSKLQKEQANLGNLDLTTYNHLRDLKATVIREIEKRDGFGPIATSTLLEFNQLCGSKISPDRDLGSTIEEKQEKSNTFKNAMDQAIEQYVVQNLTNGNKVGIAIIEANHKMDSLKIFYSDLLKEIIADNTELKINDSTKFHPQIITLINLVSGIDEIATAVNKQTGSLIIPNLNIDHNTNSIPRSQYIGQFDHTLASVGERINRGDTWGVLLLVLFIDLIVPLAVYFMIRSGEGNGTGHDSRMINWLTGRKSPTKF